MHHSSVAPIPRNWSPPNLHSIPRGQQSTVMSFFRARGAQHKQNKPLTQGPTGSLQCSAALKLRLLIPGQTLVPRGQQGSQQQSPAQPWLNCLASPSLEASPAVPSASWPAASPATAQSQGNSVPLLKSTLSLMIMSTLIHQENVELLGAAFYSWSVFSLSLF